jgi:hypothetical protein
MALSLPTQVLDTIITRGRAYFRTSFPGFPMGVKQFFGQLARAVGVNIWAAQKTVEELDNDIVPSSQSSDAALSAWAFLLGLPNGAGGFGRLVATPGSGGRAPLTGVQGTTYLDGLVATAEDGSTQIELSGTVAIPGAPPGLGSVLGQFNGITPGTVSNLPIGSVMTWDNPPAGADPTFVLTSALTDGEDIEQNPAVLLRILQRLQTPPRGGVAQDYRNWAEAIASIVGVYVFPRRSGTGTVDVVVVVGGSGQGRVPSPALVAQVQAIVDSLRPVAAERANLMAPYAPNGRGHLARVRVQPNGTINRFDWDSSTASYTVDTYTPGSPAKLKLNILAPADLKAAIDAYKAAPSSAAKPRLQVLSTGSVINPGIGCVDYADAGGKTELTLDTLPSTWTPPTAGDTVYAYGPVVATIAAALLNTCDALGPSRVSGFGDQLTPWLDTLSVSKLIAAAEDATDSSGNLLINEVLAAGCTIDGLQLDVEGADATDNPPELLYLSHVAVTP